MRAYASSAVKMPPTPTMGTETLRYKSRQTWSARSRSGAPERPPCSAAQRPERRDVVLRGALVGGVLVAADVDADRPRQRRQRLQPARHHLRTGVVEAHPIDDGLVAHQTEQARAVVAALRPRRD